MKVVINACFGGFSLSPEAVRWMAERGHEGAKADLLSGWSGRTLARNDPLLVQVVEALGKKANGEYADLAIVEIPDGVEWEIDEYDGIEHVAEQHRTWR